MQDKDKMIIKDSALVLADSFASNIPGLNIAWGLCKGLYGAGIKLRENRALEWVDMIRDNPKIFTEKLLNEESFQDGFVYIFENYLKERNEEKRKYIKNIFLNFTKSSNHAEFPIENYTYTLSQLLMEDITLLKAVNKELNDKHKILNKSDSDIEKFKNLIKLGIIELMEAGELKMQLRKLIDPFSGPSHSNRDNQVVITSYGDYFLRFLLD